MKRSYEIQPSIDLFDNIPYEIIDIILDLVVFDGKPYGSEIQSGSDKAGMDLPRIYLPELVGRCIYGCDNQLDTSVETWAKSLSSNFRYSEKIRHSVLTECTTSTWNMESTWVRLRSISKKWYASWRRLVTRKIQDIRTYLINTKAKIELIGIDQILMWGYNLELWSDTPRHCSFCGFWKWQFLSSPPRYDEFMKNTCHNVECFDYVTLFYEDDERSAREIYASNRSIAMNPKISPFKIKKPYCVCSTCFAYVYLFGGYNILKELMDNTNPTQFSRYFPKKPVVFAQLDIRANKSIFF